MRIRHSMSMLSVGAVGLFAAACVPPDPGPTNQAPTAVIVATPTSGNAPLNVAFDGGTGSIDPDGTIVSYSWAFGDSTSGTGPTTNHTYSGGTFNAVLTVTDNGGATDTETVTITVVGDGDGDGFFPPADCNDGNSSINPAAADPAGDDVDQNCDGIDGTVNAVFVSSGTGLDTSTCGAITAPCASITQALSRSSALSLSQVYVAGGSYAKFSVLAGVDVIGGYGQNWQRGLLATGSTVATVTASFDSSVGGPVGIIANSITTATKVADLTVQGATATSGQTSYGVFVNNSTSALTLDAVQINGGTGGVGVNGTSGTAGWSGSAANGSPGANGFEPGGLSCNNTSAGAGGAGGAGSGGGNSGGAGGKGGTIDSPGCSNFLGVCSSGCDAQPGSTGVTGGGSGGGGGAGGGAGTSGFPGVCDLIGNPAFAGAAGSPGANGTNGAAGAGGAPGTGGTSGGLGTGGRGGGGGGGGGANDCNVDDAGAGGGGGGAGGARASVAGGGGGAGAPAVGLRLVNSSPTLVGIQINLGTGGKGGSGGSGAFGQPGGSGGSGGAGFDVGGAGGSGGAGGAGGGAGEGGGGGGGAAIGVSRTASSTLSGSVSYSGGAGGAGGVAVNPGAVGTVNNTAVIG